MNYSRLPKILEKESLVFISTVLLGGLLLPTFILLVMSFFGRVPRNESIFQGYRYLFDSSGKTYWIGVIFALGPYVVFQCIRVIRWLRKRSFKQGADENIQ